MHAREKMRNYLRELPRVVRILARIQFWIVYPFRWLLPSRLLILKFYFESDIFVVIFSVYFLLIFLFVHFCLYKLAPPSGQITLMTPVDRNRKSANLNCKTEVWTNVVFADSSLKVMNEKKGTCSKGELEERYRVRLVSHFITKKKAII